MPPTQPDYTYTPLDHFDSEMHDGLIAPYFKRINDGYTLSAADLQSGLEPGGELKMAVAHDTAGNIAGAAVMAVYSATEDRPAMAYRIYEAPAPGIASKNKIAEIQKGLAKALTRELPQDMPIFAEVPTQGYDAANRYEYTPQGMRTVSRWAEKEGWRLTVQNHAHPEAPLPYSLLKRFTMAWGRLNSGDRGATLTQLDNPQGNDMGIGKYLDKMREKSLEGHVPLEGPNVSAAQSTAAPSQANQR